MAHEPTKKMIETPHINVLDHCRKCPHLLASKNLTTGQVDWGTLRNDCRCCKTGTKGIYKADAIYDLYELETELKTELQECYELLQELKSQKQLNKGKKATRYRTHGKRIMELHNEGCNISKISRITGLNWQTVKSVITKLKEE